MADSLLNIIENGELDTGTTIDILDHLTSEEYMSRKINTVNRFKRNANLTQGNTHSEKIDYYPQRKINKQVMDQLRIGYYIKIIIMQLFLGHVGLENPTYLTYLGITLARTTILHTTLGYLSF